MVYHIEFEPLGRRGECPSGKSILECARQLGVGLVNICGGHGKCKTCKVQVLKGVISEPAPVEQVVFSAQEISEGWRLACQTYPVSDCRLYIPPESMTTLQKIQIEGQEVVIAPEPLVKAYHVQLPEPTLSDLRSDATRLLDMLEKQHKVNCRSIDIDVLRDISTKLRSWGWQAYVSVRNNEVISISPRGSRCPGIAVDLGTSKIAGYLVDLDNGETLVAKGIVNPQLSYGEDIASRIYHAIKSPDKANRLCKLVVLAIDQLAADLCAQVSAQAREIVDAVIVGNTVMHHLALGLPVAQLAQSPFVAATKEALDIKARDIGLHLAPGAYVHMLPNIVGFVGADHVSMLLATGVRDARGLVVALDIGTNTEVSLINNGTITSVSCASGPAFEGGHIRYGMRAASGAIERLQIENDVIEYQTVDGALPAGLCGSGIVDAVAQLYLAGTLDKSGRMKKDHSRVRTKGNQREFVLVSEQDGQSLITITQHDIRELQLAKAAIRAGIQVLLDDANRYEEEIEQVIIAGAFGTYIDVRSAVTIGMLPSLPLERFKQVGNAAGSGAKMALLSQSKRAEARTLASQIRYIELASAPKFNQIFIQSNYLGLYRIKNGEREEITQWKPE